MLLATLGALQSTTSRDNRSQICQQSRRNLQNKHTTQRDHQSCTAEKTRLQCPIKVIKTQFITIITSYVKLNNCWPLRHFQQFPPQPIFEFQVMFFFYQRLRRKLDKPSSEVKERRLETQKSRLLLLWGIIGIILPCPFLVVVAKLIGD